ncbi:MAG: adenylate cyclase [Candidatus Peregrinibacteria bacterium Greene1014_49]|nr:MAG: adenylate cyclase [Candidatus Peregrinibacteria bacterium Greene1014_49]
MNAIPAGVEAALLEAGFSPTEVVILRRLLADDALTLREIALRTGKSTGVLDQAMKKLLQKNIVRKEVINDSTKFAITSLHAVSHWMEDDTKQKRELMARRQQSFETFIRTFEQDKKRPEIEYFEGIDGLAQAYRKLLDSGKEIIGYVPVFCSIEDHPLRDFMVEWFRQRRKRGMFSRIITHNTPLGRRYLSRDIFEYRQSALVDEQEYPFTFEKLICGDTVVCFNYAEKRACMLKYPELAAMERSFFESQWRMQFKKEPVPAPVQVTADGAALVTTPIAVSPAAVSLRVRVMSGVRDFFLSRKSIGVLCGIAVLSAGLTFYLYQYTKALQFQRMQDTVKSIAVTGAFQFEPRDLDALQVETDWRKAEWKKVVITLEKIRKNNEDITFAYIFRKTKNDPSQMEFVADSHSIYPYANTDEDSSNNVDVDGNGIFDAIDVLQWPGQPYPTPPQEAFLGYEKATANSQFYEDSWGKYVSGYAPIINSEGRVVGVLAVDMRAKLLDERISDVFQPILYFLGFFIFFVFIRLAAFNRSLFVELWKFTQMRKVLIILVISGELAFAITFGLYQYMLRQTIHEVGSRIMAIVSTGAPEFNVDDLDKLRFARDMKTDAYQRVFKKLNQIRDANPELKYIYIMRGIDGAHLFEFVADADSNYTLPWIGPDFNGDGQLTAADENVSPGVRYYAQKNSRMLDAFSKPTFEDNFYSDQWGTWISGFAPIKSSNGNVVLGADVDASMVLNTLHKRFAIWIWFTGILSIALFLIWFRKVL